MKTMTRILCLALVGVMLCCTLASCATSVSGTYSAEATIAGNGVKTAYKFGAFGKVTLSVTTTLLGNSTTKEYKGKYKIKKTDDGKYEITFTFDNEEGTDKNSGTVSFEKTKNGDKKAIKLAGVTYTKE